MKQRNIHHLFAVASLLLLATLVSCGKENDMSMPADDVIRFDNQIGESFGKDLTKGTITDNANLNEFGVFAYYLATSSYTADATPNHMYNTHVTHQNGVWIYTPQQYWPQQGSVSFFAYTPYTDSDPNVSVVCTKGAPVVTYAVPDDVRNHRDLMLSAPNLNKTKQDGLVTLLFHHALVCLDFNARVNGVLAQGQSIKVTAIRIGKFKNKASCNYELQSGITRNFSEDATDEEYTLAVTEGTLNEQFLTETPQQITSTNGCPMLWPQTIDDTDKMFVTAEYTSNGKTRTTVFEQNIKQFVPDMVVGKRYIFNLLFAPLTSMTLTCQVVEWDVKTIEVPDFN